MRTSSLLAAAPLIVTGAFVVGLATPATTREGGRVPESTLSTSLDRSGARAPMRRLAAATSDPAAVSWGAGRIDLFVRGPDNAIWHKYFQNGWSGWESLGGSFTSGPDVASWGANRLDIFGRGTDGTLYHKAWDNGWGPWEQLGTEQIVGDPGAASWAAGRIDVFVRGTDNAMYHKYYQGSWSSGYEALGGVFTSGLDASSWGSGRIDAFGRGTDNALYHKSWQGSWSGFEQLGSEPIVGDPAAVSWGSGRIDVFVRGTDNAIYHKYFQNAWSGYESLGGVAASGPDASSWGANRLDVFVVGTDGAVYHKWYDAGQWGGWESLGAPEATATIATISPITSGTTLQPTSVTAMTPSGVTVTGATPVSATITWNAPSGATGYKVLRATSANGPFAAVTPSPISATSFVDATLMPSTTYYWRVEAQYSGGTPYASAAVSATTPAPRNPKNFIAFVPYTDSLHGQVKLQWDPVPGASYYSLTLPSGFYSNPSATTVQQVTGTTYTHSVGTFIPQRYRLVTYFQRSDGQTVADENNPTFVTGTALPSHGFVPPSNVLTQVKWLTYKGKGDTAETKTYYATIDPGNAKDTFGKWLSANGFVLASDPRARYFNAQDLNLGRDSQCHLKSDGTIACYQANAGPKPGDANFPSPEQALDDLVNSRPAFAFVSMDVVNGEVQFYAYGPDSSRVLAAALDNEGKKPVPHVCIVCHGGAYNQTAHRVTNASFLPFDVSGHKFAGQVGFRLADQQEAIRQLNALVRSSNPNKLNTTHNPIVSMIDGWYGNNVNTPGTTQNTSYVPPGWAQKPNVYDVFARTCRTCHLASVSYDFMEYQQLKQLATPPPNGGPSQLEKTLCISRTMPQNEPAFRKFWLDLIPFHPSYFEDPSVLGGINCKI